MANQSKPTVGRWQSCPPEVLCEVIKRLNPISLIRLSQANSFLRQMIKPGKREWVEYLLAIECTKEYGGGLPVFQRHNHFLKAEETDKRWQGIRWACTGCMKLLSHIHFDNHSLLKVGYRKPIPGTPAADGILTSWTITSYGKKWGRKLFNEMSDEQLWHRRHYGTRQNHLAKWADKDKMWEYAERVFAVGVNPFHDADEPTLYDFMLNVEEMGLDRWGTKRHLRKCNECQYQANQLGSENVGRHGSAAVPIQTSRKILFGSAIERFLPGYLSHIQYEPPRCRYTNSAGNPFNQSWSMYMVRCPGCQQWQELREFRLGDAQRVTPALGRLSWVRGAIDEEFLRDIRCNACFVREHGPEKMGSALLSYFHSLIEFEKTNIELMLWNFLALWGELLKEANVQALADPEELGQCRDFIEKALERTEYEQEILSDRQRVLYRKIFMFCEDVRERLRGMDPYMDMIWYRKTVFEKVLDFYEDYQARWKWLHSAILQEAQEDADTLTEWALNRDGASLI